jgi:4,5-dihydroxyphthalate decarboxylase
MEQEYYRETKVWPIMHIIAVQKHALDENPWVARYLLNAFVESKRRSLERILDPAVSRYPLPWLSAYASKMRDMFEGDPFRYGIEENRPTIEQFLRYAYEQGIAKRHAKPEEIFPKGFQIVPGQTLSPSCNATLDFRCQGAHRVFEPVNPTLG